MKVSKSIIYLLTLAISAYAEPPVPNYSTTHQDAFSPPPVSAPSASYGAPSAEYGPPSAEYGPPLSSSYGPPPSGPPRHTTAVLRPSPSYGAPSGQSAFRGRMRHGGFGGGSSFRGRQRRPSSDYGAPPTPSTNYGAPPSNNYGPPPTPSSNYGAPPAPSSNYGAPPSSNYGPPRRGGHGGGGYGGYDDGSNEPANYQFSYHVQDASSGNDFGHQETREGHVARGMYMVLLPDGRRQIVEYVADETGYHPTVRYEGEANQGYPSGPSGSSGGYRY